MKATEIMSLYTIENWADGSFAVVDASGLAWFFADEKWDAVMWLAELAERVAQ